MEIDLNLLYEPGYNYRKHPDQQIKNLAKSLETFGQRRTISVWPDGSGKYEVLAGNGITFAARLANWKTLECTIAPEDWDSTQRKAYAAADNQGGAEDDQLMLAQLLEEVNNDGRIELEALGSSKEQLQSLLDSLGSGMLQTGEEQEELPTQEAVRQTLAERFIVPPFSVLDARQGYWQSRKRAWIALGIQSELGRGENIIGYSSLDDEYMYNKTEYIAKKNGLLGNSEQARSHYKNAAPGGSLRDAMTLGKDGKTVRGDGAGRPMANPLPLGGGLANNLANNRGNKKYAASLPDYASDGGTGLLIDQYRRQDKRLTWVSGDRPEEELDETSRKNLAAQPQSGTSIFDPVLCELVYRWFSPGGASILDPFAGGSVRGIVAAKLNRKYTGIDLRPEQIEANRTQAQAMGLDIAWHVGDSRHVKTIAPGEYDLIFSCPPYADLEVYSDNPQDLSTLDYPEFLASYRHIIAESVSMLKQDRFACFVVGDVRDKKGFYRNFVSDTIAAFQDAGATLYNEAILVTVVGSLPIRVGKQFQGYRKLGKTHQNVLVFYKGEPGKIKTSFGEVEAGEVFSDGELP